MLQQKYVIYMSRYRDRKISMVILDTSESIYNYKCLFKILWIRVRLDVKKQCYSVAFLASFSLSASFAALSFFS